MTGRDTSVSFNPAQANSARADFRGRRPGYEQGFAMGLSTRAEVITQTRPVSRPLDVDGFGAVQFQPFDDSLGTLVDASVHIEGRYTDDASVSRPSGEVPAPGTITLLTHFQATM